MLTATPVHPEGPRYAAPIVYLSGLWLDPRALRNAASFLGHRGWQGSLLDTRSLEGGVRRRAIGVAQYVRSLGLAPILIGYDVGALVAVATAAEVTARALVLVSPLCPGAPGTHALAWSRGLVWSLFRRRPVGVPGGRVGELLFRDVPAGGRDSIAQEDPRLLAELARRSPIRRPASMPPTLVLRGGLDPIVSRDDARGFADRVDGELDEIPDRGHWLLSGPAWQECVQRVHRWLVQRLGEGILELYAEAMADRGDDGDEA